MTQSESDLGGQLEKLISTVVIEIGKIFRTGWDFLFAPRRFDYATSLARADATFDRAAETRESLYSGPLTYLSVTCLWFTAYLYSAAKMKSDSRLGLFEFVERAVGSFDWKIIFVFLLPFVFCVALYSAVATKTFRVFGKETTFKYQMRLNSYFVGTYALGLIVIGPSYVLFASAAARGQKGYDFGVLVYLSVAACVAGLLVPRSVYRYFKILCRATSSNMWLVIIVLVAAGIGFFVAVAVAEILILPIFVPFLRDGSLGAV